MLSRRTFVQAAAAMAVTPARAAGSPVLVELFTSQGCSSCPPADAVLAALAARADVVALAFHVDYWDYIGWKDPYAAPAYTRRQRQYRTAFANKSVYTPQMVFNGRIEFPGQTEAEAVRALAAARGPGGPVLSLTRSDVGFVIALDGADKASEASIFAAVYGRPSATKVRRGENAGRTLSNANMVLELVNLGPAAARVNWRPALAQAAGVAVWLQPADLGPVLSAAQLTLS